MENGREVNYWPGFVDAFSNLVLTLVFVMVIFVLAMVYLSVSLAKKHVEVEVNHKIAQQSDLQKNEIERLKTALMQADNTIKKNEELQKLVNDLKIQLKKTTRSAEPKSQHGLVGEINVKESPPVKGGVSEITVDKVGDGIVIRYPLGKAELDKAAIESLGKFMGDPKDFPQFTVIDILSTSGPETYTEARRAAYFRAVLLRNYIVENGFPSNQIKMHVVDQTDNAIAQEGKVVIKLRRLQK